LPETSFEGSYSPGEGFRFVAANKEELAAALRIDGITKAL